MIGLDLNGDGELSVINQINRPSHYVGAAKEEKVENFLYPTGTEFLHTVRYVGVDEQGNIYNAPRMKEVRYMVKYRYMSKRLLGVAFDEEYQDKYEGNLPRVPWLGDRGIDNKFGWWMQGFIEDEHGDLRKQGFEETFFCAGCHGTIGSVIDSTFSFTRKVDGPEGWGYIDLRKMADAPSYGETKGEILQYLERVGGGNEFRQNEEIQQKYFNNGQLDVEKVLAAKNIYELITPSRERALALNKAYRLIVEEQSFLEGRDATIVPSVNVFDEVDPEKAPVLPEDRQFSYDLRLDWKPSRTAAQHGLPR